MDHANVEFLDRLAKATQALSDPEEVMRVTARLLGRHLRANRCAYAEVDADEDHFTLTGDFSEGVASITGYYAFSQFGDECLRLMRANLPYVVNDVATDARLTDAEYPAYRLTAIEAVICIPLHKDGRFVAAMAVHQRVPRNWAPEDLELVQIVGSRCWESLQRTRTQRALQLTNDRLSVALSAAQLGDWTWSAADDVVTLSQRAAELFGLPQDKTVSWTSLSQGIHEDDRARVLESVARSLETGEAYQEEYRLCTTLQDRWLAAWGTPQKDAWGQVTGIFGVLQDVTRSKQMENALRLQAEELKQADHRKDEFLAILAHELRNPLAPIGLAAQLLRKTAEPSVLKTAELIRSQVNQMSRLLDDLLDTSRIKSGSLVMKMEAANAKEIVEVALQNAGPLLRSRKHALSVHVEEGLSLHADTVRMAQVLANLLTNAAKYTPVSGRVRLTASARDGQCEFVVSDSGIGLKEESIERIFGMFAQEETVLHRPEGGLGIGLALVRAIVTAHGGVASAHSPGLGQGSSFVVRVPLFDAAARATPGATPAPVAEQARPLDILVADDNASAVNLLAELLVAEGHRAIVAMDGAQALALAQALQPEVLILDIGMPRLTGYEVAQAIRRTAWGSAAMLIAATGWGQASDKARAHEAGFDAHLTKPFDPQALLSLLAQRAQRLRPAANGIAPLPPDTPAAMPKPEGSAPPMR